MTPVDRGKRELLRRRHLFAWVIMTVPAPSLLSSVPWFRTSATAESRFQDRRPLPGHAARGAAEPDRGAAGARVVAASVAQVVTWWVVAVAATTRPLV